MSLKDIPLMDGLKREAVRRHRPGDLRAAELVAKYKGLPKGVETPSVMVHQLKRAARAMTLTDKAVRVYEALFSHTNAIDWHPNRLALVWPSDEALMRETGVSDRSNLRKLIRQLRDAGLIAYKDSPNKARYGRRLKGDGSIDYASSYGFILNSIALMYEDLVRIGDDYDLRRRYRAMLNRNLRSVRSEAAEVLDAVCATLDVEASQAAADELERLDRDVSAARAEDTALEAAIARYEACVDRLRSLCASEVSNPLDDYAAPSDADRERMSSYLKKEPRERGRNDLTIRNITSPSPNLGNRLSDEVGNEIEGGERPKPPALDERAGQGSGAAREASTHRYEPVAVPIDMVKACLPWAVLQDIRDDHGYFQIFDVLKEHAAYYGIPAVLLDDARLTMRRDVVCGCIAVIMSKRAGIRNPANYLRGLMAKHRDGALRIERSLFGIIKENKKPKSIIHQMRLDGSL